MIKFQSPAGGQGLSPCGEQSTNHLNYCLKWRNKYLTVQLRNRASPFCKNLLSTWVSTAISYLKCSTKQKQKLGDIQSCGIMWLIIKSKKSQNSRTIDATNAGTSRLKISIINKWFRGKAAWSGIKIQDFSRKKETKKLKF